MDVRQFDIRSYAEFRSVSVIAGMLELRSLNR